MSKRGSYDRRTGGSKNLHEGMTRKSPPGVDASMKPKGGSVNGAATRDGVAKTPRTLGPRNA